MERNVAAFIKGAVLVAAGVLLILIYGGDASLAFVLGVLLTVCACAAILFYFMNRYNSFEETLLSLVGGVLTLVLGVFLITSPNLAGIAAEKVVAVWLMITGLIYLLNAYTYKRGGDAMWVLLFIMAALSMALGIVAWSYAPLWDIIIGVIIPAYLILLGISALASPLFKGYSHPAVPLPALAEAFLPRALIEKLDSQAPGKAPDAAGGAAGDDVEILIHTSKRPDTFWGHVDIAFGDYVFAYGNYDLSKESRRLFGLLGDGVFAICPRGAYIDFSTVVEEKTIFGYRLALDMRQKSIFIDNTKRFLCYCEPWAPEEKDRDLSIFAWGMAERGARLYKVSETRFKTFSGVSTNCALLTEVLLEGTGVPRARSIGGIVTPGAMLNLFEKELHRKGSIVAAKKEYRRAR